MVYSGRQSWLCGDPRIEGLKAGSARLTPGSGSGSLPSVRTLSSQTSIQASAPI